jgi:hypothetical protein
MTGKTLLIFRLFMLELAHDPQSFVFTHRKMPGILMPGEGYL